MKTCVTQINLSIYNNHTARLQKPYAKYPNKRLIINFTFN